MSLMNPENKFSTFSANAQTFIAAKTLMRVKKDVIVYGLGKKEKLPNRFSKTFQYTRYEKLNLPYAPLSEGQTPADGDQMTVATVQAIMDQWGSYVNISDVGQITAKHPALQQAQELIAEQATETIDRECIKLLLSNSRVSYPGSVANRVSLATNSYITTTAIKKQVAALKKNGARPYMGRFFVGLMDNSVAADMTEDSTFQNAASYSQVMRLNNGEVGIWHGVRWMESNLLPTISRLADVTTASSGASGGSLANATTYYIKVVAVSKATGFEMAATQVQSQATGASDEAISVVMPADTDYTYKLYFGASNVTTYLHSELNAAGATVVVLGVPAASALPTPHPNTGVIVHFCWVLGLESFAVPELMSLQTFLTPDQASDSDPLKQRRKLGWKVMFKPVICNELFIERLEVASRYNV